MIKIKNLSKLLAVMALLVLSACGGDSSSTPCCFFPSDPEGTLDLDIVSASDASLISDALIQIFDSSSTRVVSGMSDSDGNLIVDLLPGSYTLKVEAQGYNQSPPENIPAVPFQIVEDETLEKTVNLGVFPDTTATAFITGNAGTPGTLVVAYDEVNDRAVSTVSDENGDYTIFNVVPADYDVNGFKSGFLTTQESLTINASGETIQDLVTVADTGLSITGQITFLAAANSIVDITLLHPETLDIIPGLTTDNDENNNYELGGVPAGSYLAWASFENDDYVMDPDWIFKNGDIPAAIEVTVTTADSVQDFSVTDAVDITSPSNASANLIPGVVDSLTPTFSWAEYASASEYAVEVFDSDGNTVWGGFDEETGVPQHEQITGLSVVFDADSSAAESLQNGGVYRWSVTALKFKQQAEKLLPISVSEDQLGIFQVSL